jgi:predicted RNA binding protein YcfA (HicA-like mRNA interferase family)
MRFNELVQLLEKNGFVWINSGKSSKRIYSNGERRVIIHYHAAQDVKKGMLRRILKDAGIQQ